MSLVDPLRLPESGVKLPMAQTDFASLLGNWKLPMAQTDFASLLGN